jgi:cell division protein FtsL
MVQEQLQRSMTKSSRQTRELARRLRKLTEVQAAVGWGLILLVIALLGVIYLNQSSKIATVGRRVQTLQYELGILQSENADIEREIAQAQSLSRLQKEAKSMGFVRTQPGSVEYLVVPDYPAITTAVELQQSQNGALQSPVETMQEGLWLALEAKFNDLIRGESRE